MDPMNHASCEERSSARCLCGRSPPQCHFHSARQYQQQQPFCVLNPEPASLQAQHCSGSSNHQHGPVAHDGQGGGPTHRQSWHVHLVCASSLIKLFQPPEAQHP
ncbi:Os05g0440201, partial [Oryza sativa Japonica Group]